MYAQNEISCNFREYIICSVVLPYSMPSPFHLLAFFSLRFTFPLFTLSRITCRIFPTLTQPTRKKAKKDSKRERKKQSQAHQLESMSMHFNANGRQHMWYKKYLLCVYKTPQRRANIKILSENNSAKKYSTYSFLVWTVLFFLSALCSLFAKSISWTGSFNWRESTTHQVNASSEKAYFSH